MADHLRCKCKKIFQENEFAAHFSKCDDFKKHFKRFDHELGDLLKSYSEERENLLILRVLLKQYINVLDKKIKHV